MTAATLLTTMLIGLSYGEARQASIEQERPLIVLVGAEWCGACRIVKPCIPRLRRMGCFCYLDYDRHPKLAKLLGVKTLPHLIIWRPNASHSGQSYRSVDSIRKICE